jgi:tripartite motif-containing protein 71
VSRLSPFPSPLRWAALWLLVAGLVIASLPGAIAATSPPEQASTCTSPTTTKPAPRTLGTFGTPTAFGGPNPAIGQFVQPLGITNSGGNLYVITGGEYGYEFTTAGALTGAKDFGAPGSLGGQFNGPQGIAVDSTGNIYVADTNNNRIEKFSATGTFVCEWGAAGTANGDMTFPTDVQIDGSGNVYVADTSNNRIDVFNSNGVFEGTWGTGPGTGPGQFDRPTALVLDGSTLFVSDSDNSRIEKWTVTASGGTVSATFVSDLATAPAVSDPTGLAVDGSGNLWVANVGTDTVTEFSEATGALETTIGSFGAGPGQFAFNSIYDLREGLTITGGHLFVCDPGNNRVEEFTTTGTFVSQFGGLPAGTLALPSGITQRGTTLYVADSNNHQVQEFSTTGTPGIRFGTLGTAAGQFQYPDGIAVDGSGNAYVADALNNNVQKWNASTGTYEGLTFGSEGSANGQLFHPHGVAVDSSGNVYVADTGNNRVEEFTPTGAYTATFGTGAAPAALNAPEGAAVDSSGDVYVADTGNNRIVEFSPSGTLLAAMGAVDNQIGTGNGQFYNPGGVAVGGNGNIYVADSLNARIQEVNPGLTTVLAVLAPGFGPLVGQVNNPAAVVADSSGTLYVADTYNSRVETWPVATQPNGNTTIYLPLVYNNAPVPTTTSLR